MKDLRWPIPISIWLWLVSRNTFSKIPFLVASGICLTTLMGREIQVGHRQVSVGYYGSELFTPIGVAIVIAVFGWLIHAGETRIAQRARDRMSAEILNAVQGNQAPRYFLYLRPFFLTGRMTLQNQEHGAVPLLVNYYSEPETIDFETKLERAIRNFGLLIALGQPGEVVGAGRLRVSEDEWKGRFQELARSAAGIFVVPSHRTGTKWEIEWLQNHSYLSKCIFVMPPRTRHKERTEWTRLRRVKMPDMKACWQKATEVLAGRGIQLPPYVEGGLFFKLGAAGAMSTSAKELSPAWLNMNLI
jgi:hypothetical protein